MIKYVKVYHDLASVVDELSDTEAGRLFKAILAYGNAGEVRTLAGAERLVFTMVKAQMDRDRNSYTQTVERNRANGSKGGRPKKPSETENNPVGFSKTQDNPQKPKKSQDKDKDKESSSAREAWMDDDEVDEIMAGHKRVYDEAQRCGFDLNTGTLDALTALIGQYGADRMIDALTVCLEHGAKSLAYLRKVLEGKPKAAADEPPRLSRLF